jgi:hypothetical protein
LFMFYLQLLKLKISKNYFKEALASFFVLSKPNTAGFC